ncbi:glycosyltransferase family 4 protein [Castellaniella sp. GW247-6E4]|uniref:glycosyltransferase family 4 protein n=1 Tax=Castellaniella sp. GW247-6E4 TaxID=3140380 RepID=UPI003315C2CD
MTNPAKPKIALIIDSESWAFANISRQLVKHLGDQFDFRVIPAEIIDNIVQVLMMTRDCAVTHFFWRDFLNAVTQGVSKDYCHGLGFASHEAFLSRYVRNRTITTSIYDHLFLTDAEIGSRTPLFNDIIDGYTVSSQRLMDAYKNIDRFPNPDGVTEDGVDLGLFKPLGPPRFGVPRQRPMVIGWAGNSLWSRERGEDFKGLHTILKPAVDQLQREGLDIRLELADRQQSLIAHEHMPEYYAKLDLYVCPSKIEGTPNPVLEAMACGVPVISTDVGVVPQVFDGDPFGMILPERSVAALKARIRRHYESEPGRIRRISEYGLLKIRAWSWDRKAENFRQFFDRLLETSNAPAVLS